MMNELLMLDTFRRVLQLKSHTYPSLDCLSAGCLKIEKIFDAEEYVSATQLKRRH